jgi:hypothetical protein
MMSYCPGRHALLARADLRRRQADASQQPGTAVYARAQPQVKMFVRQHRPRLLKMRVRRLIAERKTQESDTGWRHDDIPPRFAPVFARTRPIRAGWQWRSAKAVSAERQYILTALCNSLRDNWQAMLILYSQEGASMIGRYEYHGSHPGLHGHADCQRSGLELGPVSIDNLQRRPAARAFHRRTFAWTGNTFWEAARRFFRVRERKGPLL